MHYAAALQAAVLLEDHHRRGRPELTRLGGRGRNGEREHEERCGEIRARQNP